MDWRLTTLNIFTFLIPRLVQCFPLDDNSIEETAVDLSYLGERVYREPNAETGIKVETWNETSAQNPEELGEYAEGDIVFPKRARNGLIATSFRWSNGVVPYEILGPYTASDIDVINKAISIYGKYTCIRYKLRTSKDKDYISIVNGRSGCWSSVGRIGGKQQVNLQSPSCTTKVGTALHELMHAIGFLHEQSRHERDDYISVIWQNIKKGHEDNFKKADKESEHDFGVKYDYTSVMHYSGKAFSANDRPTLVPKDQKYAKIMGQRDGFSGGDITKINAMYNCPEKTPGVTNNNGTVPEGTTDTSNEKGSSNPFVDAAVGLFSLFIH